LSGQEKRAPLRKCGRRGTGSNRKGEGGNVVQEGQGGRSSRDSKLEVKGSRGGKE